MCIVQSETIIKFFLKNFNIVSATVEDAPILQYVFMTNNYILQFILQFL